jgi:hypothetical protein
MLLHQMAWMLVVIRSLRAVGALPNADRGHVCRWRAGENFVLWHLEPATDSHKQARSHQNPSSIWHKFHESHIRLPIFSRWDEQASKRVLEPGTTIVLTERWNIEHHGESYLMLITYNPPHQPTKEQYNQDPSRVNYFPKVTAVISMASLDPTGSNFVKET